MSRRQTPGYARGEETRTRIIEAAVALFGEKGFDRTSTRDIAARAGVNAPVLQYYFDGKEGLYLSCAEYMKAQTHLLLAPVIAAVKTRLAAKPDQEGLIDCVCYIYEQVADYLLTHSQIDNWVRFMAWDGLERARVPVSVSRLVTEGLRQELQGLLRTLVGRIIGRRPEDEETRIRVVTLGSQLAVFHLAREKTLADIGWKRIQPRHIRKLKAVVRAQVTAILRAAGKSP